MDINEHSLYSRYTLPMLLVKYIVTLFLTRSFTKRSAIWLMKAAIKNNINNITRILNGIYFGGETLADVKKSIEFLAHSNISSVLDYAVEDEQCEISFDHAVTSTLRAIDLASQDINIPYVVIKPSALGSVDLYQARLTSQPSFEFYLPLWERLLGRYETIFSYAQEKSIPVMIDAEQSWIQPPVNEIAIENMIKYNNKQTIVTLTLQCYRRDSYSLISLLNNIAMKHGIVIGIKLVRGAYLEEEMKFNAHPEKLFFTTQLETDRNYNTIVDFIFDNISNFAPFFATHNQVSISKVLNHPLSSSKKIWLAQLYGVGDYISIDAVKRGAQVCKYLPYGPFKKSFPYLVRRIEENAISQDTFCNDNLFLKKEIKSRLIRSSK